MIDQEALELQNPGIQDSGILRFPSFSSSTAPGTPTKAAAASSCCTLCGGGAKRRSPSSSISPGVAIYPEYEPQAKKLSLDTSLDSAANHHHRNLDGFTKIHLPISVAAAATPPRPALRRCCSDPVRTPGSQPSSSPESFLSAFSSLQSPENPFSPGSEAAATTPSPVKPPLHPTLQRSLSNATASPSPTPSPRRENQIPWMGMRNLSRSPSSGEMSAGIPTPMPNFSREESPNFKRLKRMKERMKEMSQWWGQVAREGEEAGDVEEDGGSETYNISGASKESGNEAEEAVGVEYVGDCLCIHFKCPCSNGYQILLSGKNCYYKLV